MKAKQTPPAPAELKVFKICDWVYVAAANLEEAKAWHRRECPGDENNEEIDEDSHEVSDTLKTRTEEGENSPVITLREAINKYLAAGESPPFMVCVDRHYV